MIFYKKLQSQGGVSDVLSKQGLIYWQKGMKEQALSSMKDGLEIREKLDNKNLIAESLSYIVQFSIESNDLEAARKYFNGKLPKSYEPYLIKKEYSGFPICNLIILKYEDSEKSEEVYFGWGYYKNNAEESYAPS